MPNGILRCRIDNFLAHLTELQDWRNRRDWQSRDWDCFTVIHEDPPKERTGPSFVGAGSLPATERSDRERVDGRLNDSLARYVQFAFCGAWFYLDLPDETLGPREAEQLICERRDFFHLANRPDSPSALSPKERANNVADWHPVQKVYQRSELILAAEDMAYIWFTLWLCPLEHRLYARSAFFEGGDIHRGKLL